MSQAKILVTGAGGMLGSDLVQTLEYEYEVYGMVRQQDARPRFFSGDITDRLSTVKHIERIQPRVVIHAAAMTDVDGCETDRPRAMKVNFEGTKNVVDGCRHVKGILIYFSTDFVFDGTSREPYRESHIPNPINVYGETKLLGEFYVKSQSIDHLIIRTAWTYGAKGDHFMAKILRKGGESSQIHVVKDQVGSPTYTKDIAEALARILRLILSEEGKETLNAIYHMTNDGAASRYEVAVELLKRAGCRDVLVCPITSDELQNAAKRPLFSVLDNSRVQKKFSVKFRNWKDALNDYIGQFAPVRERKL